jgi:DNA-binding HxlR family transcriptional regulator
MENFRSGCPIASTLDLVGDRWTLVLMRDLMNGKRRYKEFLAGPEKIASNILTARLTAMVEAGLIESHLYEQRPKRYEYKLTAKGADLLPVLQAMCRWGEAHLPKRWNAPATFMKKKPVDLFSV